MGTCSTLSETPAVCGTTTHVLTFHLGFYIRIQDGKWSGNYIVFFYANRALKALFLLQASFTQSHSYKCFSFYIQAPHLIFAHTQPLMDTSRATQHSCQSTPKDTSACRLEQVLDRWPALLPRQATIQVPTIGHAQGGMASSRDCNLKIYLTKVTFKMATAGRSSQWPFAYQANVLTTTV